MYVRIYNDYIRKLAIKGKVNAVFSVFLHSELFLLYNLILLSTC